MRPAAVLLLAFLLVPLAAAQQPFEVHAPQRLDIRSGETKTVEVEAVHRCPADGTVRFSAETPENVVAHVENSSWSPCGGDGYARAATTLTVEAEPNLSSGPHVLAVAALWLNNDGEYEAAGAAIQLRVPYEGSVRVTGPAESLLLAGQTVTVELRLEVEANGDSWVRLAHDAPDTLRVESPKAVEVRRDRTGEPIPWRVRVEALAGASGDTPVVFAAEPVDALTRTEKGTGGAHRWVAKLPPGPSSEPPPSGGEGGPGAAVPPPATPPPDGPSDGIPVWALGAGLAAAAAVALWWALR